MIKFTNFRTEIDQTWPKFRPHNSKKSLQTWKQTLVGAGARSAPASWMMFRARSAPELETLPGTTAGRLMLIVGLVKWKMIKWQLGSESFSDNYFRIFAASASRVRWQRARTRHTSGEYDRTMDLRQAPELSFCAPRSVRNSRIDFWTPEALRWAITS